MIKIERDQCPEPLQKPPDDFVEDDYKRDEVKESLLLMQYGKCCYCERDLYNLSPTEREVEHYLPTSLLKDENGVVQWNLANAWENLLYACRTCNNRKSNKNPFNEESSEREIIDPTDGNIDPEEHIDFVNDDILPVYKEKNGSALGRTTIDKLRLEERRDLYRAFRKRRLELKDYFIDLVNAIEVNDNPRIESKKSELERAMSAHLPFTCFTRSFISKRIVELNEIELPQLQEQHNQDYNSILINFPTGNELVM